MDHEFKGVALFHSVPVLFSYGEIFRFHGMIEEENTSLFSIVFVYFQEPSSDGKGFHCRETLVRGKKEFEISCRMKLMGKFFITIFINRGGSFS